MQTPPRMMPGIRENEACVSRSENIALPVDPLWNEIPRGELNDLRNKIGCGLYGRHPFDLCDESTGFLPKEAGRIKEVLETLKRHYNLEVDAIDFACISIDASIDRRRITLPILLFRKRDSESGLLICTDARDRVYQAWHIALFSEKLPDGFRCTPLASLYDSSLPTDDVDREQTARIAARVLHSDMTSWYPYTDSEPEHEDLTVEDVFHLTTSPLNHSDVMTDFRTAPKIIKQIQEFIMQMYREEMSLKAVALFNDLTAQLRGSGSLHGSAQVIRALSKIDAVPQLFELMVSKHVENSKIKLTADGESDLGIDGLLMVNEDLEIHPLTLLGIPSESRNMIFELSADLLEANNDIKNKLQIMEIDQCEADRRRSKLRKEYHSGLKTICKLHRLTFGSQIQKSTETWCKLQGIAGLDDSTVGGRYIFRNLTTHQGSRFSSIIDRFLCDEEIIRMVLEYAEHRACKCFEDFEIHTEFLIYTVESRRAYQECELRKEGINRKAREVEAKRRARSDFLERKKEAFRELAADFDKIESEIGPLNEKSASGSFKTNARAAYHYAKHKNIGEHRNLTPEKFFDLIHRIVEMGESRRFLAQDGTCTLIHFDDPGEGLRVVKMIGHTAREWTSGLVTIIQFNKNPPPAPSART